MSDLLCDVCNLRSHLLRAGLCPGCYKLVYPADVELDGLKVRIADDCFYQCDACPAPIDGPGLCPRCQRELDEQLERMMR